MSAASGKLRGGLGLLAGREPRVHEAREPQEERRDAVLHMVVRRPGVMARQPARERLRRLREVHDRKDDQHDGAEERKEDEGAILRHGGSLTRRLRGCCSCAASRSRANGSCASQPQKREKQEGAAEEREETASRDLSDRASLNEEGDSDTGEDESHWQDGDPDSAECLCRRAHALVKAGSTLLPGLGSVAE